jgi:choloylglycine hydrolase
MCTAISFNANKHYFGRNLDLEIRFGEKVAITPRNYPFEFKFEGKLKEHYAIIGMAMVSENYPLYFDATNEKGLSIAGLNFVGNSYLGDYIENRINLAPYELIPYLLGKYGSVAECAEALKSINLVDVCFNPELQNAELHWMIADEKECIVLENMKDGMKIYKNSIGVLTNNPPFEYQMLNLNNYMAISNSEPQNKFSDKIKFEKYSRGMGGLGLPGDFSSVSRFVRGTFAVLNSVVSRTDIENITQFFHILDYVSQIEGCIKVGDKYERTQYSSCCDTKEGIYYFKTYENSQISTVKMKNESLDTKELICYELPYFQQISNVN